MFFPSLSPLKFTNIKRQCQTWYVYLLSLLLCFFNTTIHAEICYFKTSVGANIVLQTAKHLFSTVGSVLILQGLYKEVSAELPCAGSCCARTLPSAKPSASTCFLPLSQFNFSISRKYLGFFYFQYRFMMWCPCDLVCRNKAWHRGLLAHTQFRQQPCAWGMLGSHPAFCL